VGGRQEVGHIDLLDTISYFEVPEKDAKKVMIQLTGIRHKGRLVRCNNADEKRNFSEEGWAMRKPRKKKK
jgi:ATP-dependent RNA helicase DeaD